MYSERMSEDKEKEENKDFAIGENLGYDRLEWYPNSLKEANVLGEKLGIESGRIRALCAFGQSEEAHLSGDMELIKELEKFKEPDSFKLFTEAYRKRMGSLSLSELLFVSYYMGMCSGECMEHYRIKEVLKELF